MKNIKQRVACCALSIAIILAGILLHGMNAFQLMKKIGYGGSGGTMAAPSTFTTTASSVTFYVTGPSGTTLHINWGNGDSEDVAMTGIQITKTKNYGSASTRTVYFSGGGNVSLTRLSCGGNSLTTLDVSNNTALTYLSCSSNSLTALDVSSNITLTDLRCSSNSLTALDVSSNTAITDLYCGSNSLTTLDVSNNTALTYLSCSSNSLTTLDVSNNTALTYLYCSSNSLTALDVSNNTALTHLYCHSNSLSSTVINSHMADLVSASLNNGFYDGESQTPSAPPTGQGITDKATLVSRSWSVTTD